MPSAMIHLLAARTYDPDSSPLFLAGNVAPDSIDEREPKDRLHLRTAHDRPAALRAMAASVDRDNDLYRGILLHLYLDMLWDRGPLQDFINGYGSDWFLPYRRRTATASAWLFHAEPWSSTCWQMLSDFDFTGYDDACGYTRDAIRAYVRRNREWHEANRPEAIGHFSRELITEVTVHAAKSFDAFMHTGAA